MIKKSRTLWAFDFDGTLSPLVPDRHAAQFDRECYELLKDLSSEPNDLVAIISSRELDDLLSRANLPWAVIAGGSGLEIRVPGGHRLMPSSRVERRLEKERERILPALQALEVNIPGVDLEDKRWSAAVHFRQAIAGDRARVAVALGTLHTTHGVPVHYGPDVAEVQFITGMNKAQALRTLAHMYCKIGPEWQIVYAGDDQNDVQAMKWVQARKGTAIIVGDRVTLPGARYVSGPSELAKVVRHIYDDSRRAHHID